MVVLWELLKNDSVFIDKADVASTEAVTRGCSAWNVLIEISQENTCAGVSFLIGLFEWALFKSLFWNSFYNVQCFFVRQTLIPIKVLTIKNEILTIEKTLVGEAKNMPPNFNRISWLCLTRKFLISFWNFSFILVNYG